MPAIIGEELFAAVQDQLGKNKKARARKKSEVEFLLTAKPYCGHCGMGMIGDSGTAGGRPTISTPASVENGTKSAIKNPSQRTGSRIW